MIKDNIPYSINARGRLVTFDVPAVMGILNVTDDSFYAASRTATADVAVEMVGQMLKDGASIIDVGACSTRPGGDFVSEADELARLHLVLDALDKEFPTAVISVDTFRGRVARECVGNHNVSIINDVSGFSWDADMLGAVVELNVPYVLTHSVGFAGDEPSYGSFIPDVLKLLAEKVWQLRQQGVADIIIDPGFGFGKSVGQNYAMLASLRDFEMLDAPILVGVSRKSMITRLLGVDAAGALPGTVALNMAALERGASILRVHDVREAVQVVELYRALGGII